MRAVEELHMRLKGMDMEFIILYIYTGSVISFARKSFASNVHFLPQLPLCAGPSWSGYLSILYHGRSGRACKRFCPTLPHFYAVRLISRPLIPRGSGQAPLLQRGKSTAQIASYKNTVRVALSSFRNSIEQCSMPLCQKPNAHANELLEGMFDLALKILAALKITVNCQLFLSVPSSWSL